MKIRTSQWCFAVGGPLILSLKDAGNEHLNVSSPGVRENCFAGVFHLLDPSTAKTPAKNAG